MQRTAIAARCPALFRLNFTANPHPFICSCSLAALSPTIFTALFCVQLFGQDTRLDLHRYYDRLTPISKFPMIFGWGPTLSVGDSAACPRRSPEHGTMCLVTDFLSAFALRAFEVLDEAKVASRRGVGEDQCKETTD